MRLPRRRPEIVVPFRLLEACRMSLYVVAMHPQLPDGMKEWVLRWMEGYNAALAEYFSTVYGKDIFEELAKISTSVTVASDEFHAAADSESFKKWEGEINGEQ